MIDFGDWNVMVRELAGYDPDECKRIIKWPLREALLCFVNRMKKQALEQYRNDLLAWAPRSPYMKKGEPPKVPKILRE